MAEAPNWLELQKIQLFSGLSENEIYDLFKLAFVKHYKAGSTLFVEGMAGEILYVVLKGKVDICKKTNTDEIVIATMTDGDFFGELSLLDSAPRSATARVVEDSELVAVTRKVFDDMLHADPKVTSKLLIEFLKTAATRLPRFDGLIKLNFESEGLPTTQVHALGGRRYCGEAVFVPHPDGDTEDAGWLLTLVHDEQQNQSELLIVDARDLECEPVARVLLPQRVPYGFHAIWISNAQIQATL